jgi:hypothetical protein
MSSIIATAKTNNLSILVLKSPVSDYLEVETLRKTVKGMKEREKKGYIIHRNSK